MLNRGQEQLLGCDPYGIFNNDWYISPSPSGLFGICPKEKLGVIYLTILICSRDYKWHHTWITGICSLRCCGLVHKSHGIGFKSLPLHKHALPRHWSLIATLNPGEVHVHVCQYFARFFSLKMEIHYVLITITPGSIARVIISLK